MVSISEPFTHRSEYGASEVPLVRGIDRWIYVAMVVLFLAIILAGFVPDSLDQVSAVKAGLRSPFPPILHVHAVLMGSFLLLLLAQTILAATGNHRYHQRLGLAAFGIVPALVIAGLILVPTTYHSIVGALHAAPPEAQADIRQLLRVIDNIMLLQLRVGVLFPLFITIGLSVRRSDPGLHKRLMILAVAPTLPAAFDRMTWLPNTMPHAPYASDIYILLAILPMFAWDLIRTGKVHKAYLIWLAAFVPASVLMYALWDSAWWHAMAPRLVGA